MTSQTSLSTDPERTASAGSPANKGGPGRAALVLVLAGALVVRVAVGAGQDLWDDEVASLLVARTPLSALGSYYRSDPHPPLFFTLLKPWAALGASTAWLRLFPALCGTATIGVLYAWVRRAVDHRTALWAAVLLTLAPFHVWASTELRSHALVALLVTAAGFALWRFCREDGRPVHLAAGALLALAAAWCHYYGLIAAAALGAALLAGSSRPLRHGLVFGGIVAIGYAPWLPFLADQIGAAQSFRTLTTGWEFLFETGVQLPLACFPWRWPSLLVMGRLPAFAWAAYLAAMAVLVAPFWLFILWGWWQRSRRSLVFFAGTFSAVVLVGVFAGSRAVPGFETRYLVFLLPFLAALAAAGFAASHKKTGVACLLVLCAVFVLSDLEALVDPKSRRPDYSGLADRIDAAKGQALIYRDAAAPAFRHAAAGRFLILALAEPSDPTAGVAAVNPKAGAVFQIVINPSWNDPTGQIARALRDRFGPPRCQTLPSAMPVTVCVYASGVD